MTTKNGVKKKCENCFIDKKGKVYTWGSNRYGQLGNGTTDDSSVPICISDIEESPLKGKSIVDIYDCGYAIIAKDSNGKLYSWGRNYSGELGNGTTTNISMPVCISDIESSSLKGKNIVDGYAYYSKMIVKDSNGKLYSWGENYYGELGNGTTTNSSMPVCISDIESNPLKGKKIVDVHNYGFTIIAKDSNGKLYTWGENDYGQLGDRTTTNSSMPICISDIENSPLKGKNIVNIYMDNSAIIAKDSDGKLYSWGGNSSGELGNGTTNNSSMPICINDIETSPLKGKNIVDVYSDDSTIIAKDSNGKLYTWGNNCNGQLGNGTTENSSMPVCISDIENSPLKGKNIVDVYNIEYNYNYTKIAKDNDGKLYSWGGNSSGQLGNGTTNSSSMPVCISDIENSQLEGKNIVDVYSDDSTIIAKDSNGKLYTWGYNEYGQLGDGTRNDSSMPICISDIENSELKGKKIKDVEIYYEKGYRAIYYITEDGILYRFVFFVPYAE